MRRWRVGTLSLGVLLIVLGLIMLITQFQQVSILDKLLIWWPISLVLIGAEILWYVYSLKEEQPKVKYDVFSMFIILLIVLFSIGIYTLTSTGVLTQVSRLVSSKNITVEIPEQRISVPDKVKNIVLKIPRQNLNIESTDKNDIVVFGTAELYALDTMEAENLVQQGKVINYVEGSTMFVQFIPIPREENFKAGARNIRYTLMLPKSKKVKIDTTGYSNLAIDADVLNNIYIIEGEGWGKLSTTVASDMDLMIEAYVDDPQRLNGNANWEVSEDTGETERSRGSHVKGVVKWGDGKHKLTIIGNREIIVNEI